MTTTQSFFPMLALSAIGSVVAACSAAPTADPSQRTDEAYVAKPPPAAAVGCSRTIDQLSDGECVGATIHCSMSSPPGWYYLAYQPFEDTTWYMESTAPYTDVSPIYHHLGADDLRWDAAYQSADNFRVGNGYSQPKMGGGYATGYAWTSPVPLTTAAPRCVSGGTPSDPSDPSGPVVLPYNVN